MTYSTDIETALYNLLDESEISASAHALPADLGATLPHVHVVRTGGSVTDRVIETNNVDFDVYAEDDASAMTAASNLCGWVLNLEGSMVGTYCYSSVVTTLPYKNPDPRHPNISRATFKAQILVRMRGEENA